ncbi:hypothetical protein [Cohnella thermotolerans]|uniref:hypothetical protein n=1 Tax=Cohnella thermotolerans TaxID=329858 RepID=UPI0003F6BF2A|nr:hypothetical protein [Cohnella thermotolerans]
MIRVGLVGDYRPEVKAHAAIPQALRLAAEDLGLSVEAEWIPTPALEEEYEPKLGSYRALWIVPASPY